MIREELTRVSPNALAYTIESGGRLHYYKQWQPLDFEIVSFGIVRTVRQYDADNWRLFPTESQSDEQYEELIKAHPSTEYATIQLEAQLDNASVYLVSLAKENQEQTQEQFRDISIQIMSRESDLTGTMWGVREDGPYGSAGLRLDLYFSHERMAALVKQFTEKQDSMQVTLRGRALLFECEVESSLKETFHRSNFVLLDPAPFALEGVNFKQKIHSLTQPYEECVPASPISEPHAPPLAQPPQTRNPFAGLTAAVWGLTIALLLTSFF